MPRFLMFVQSQARPGREAEYDDWYDRHHLPEMLQVAGARKGRRLKATPLAFGPQQPLAHAALYEFEADDAQAIMAAAGQAGAEGRMTQSDALDREGSILWIYEDPAQPD